MRALPHLDWPFFDDAHRDLATRLSAWAESRFGTRIGTPSKDEAPDRPLDAACRALVAALGAAGLTRYACRPRRPAPNRASTCGRSALTRELLAWHDGLADFAFAMQGLGSGAISLAGSPELKTRYLPVVAAGRAIAAFALSEPAAGSDVAAMRTSARREGEDYRLDGTKTWISNGGIADFYCVFARTSPAELRADGSSSRAGHHGFRRGCRCARPRGRRADPGDRPAPARHAPLRGLPDTGHATHRRGGRRIQDRHAHARCLPHLGRRAALGFAPARAGRSARVTSPQRRMFGRQLADFQLTQATLAEHRHGARRVAPADLSRCVAAGPRRNTSPRRRRWPR